MGKHSNARPAGQDQFTSDTHHRCQSCSQGSQEQSGRELLNPDLTRDQWSLVLDPRHRNAALCLTVKIPDRRLGIDVLLCAAQEALIAAVRAYDPNRGAPFLPYARRRMRRAMHKRAREPQIPERLRSWRKDLIGLVGLSEHESEGPGSSCP